MKYYMITVLVVAAVWDGVTTVYGTVQVLGSGPYQLVASVLFSSLIMAFVLNTTRIMRWSSAKGFIGALTGFFWFIALCYDFYTSWLSNANLLVGGNGDSPAKIVILIGLTLLVIASPILLSMMWERGFSGRMRSRLLLKQ